LIRSGVDLGRIKLGLVDEDDSIDDKSLFKGEEFFFNEDDRGSIKDYVMPNIEVVVSDSSNGREVYEFRIEPDELDASIVPYITGAGSEANNDGFAR